MTQQQLEKFIAEINKVIKKHKIGIQPFINFSKPKLPLLSKIAVKILNRQGAKMALKFIEQK